ncbi:MAG: alpha/beta hydrolase, partial [Myxococcota bacterium]
MLRTACLVGLASCVSSTALAQAPQSVSFSSKDGLEITADLYVANPSPSTPMIVLFHQAGWSRGEYREIAPRLVEMGFNCLAVDQRSGGEVNGVSNETAKRAKAKKLGTSYVDARQDMVAALEHARSTYAEQTVIAWGSSYSSALIIQIAGTEESLVNGVLSFSPGEYFGRQGKGPRYVSDGAKGVEVPTFVTSSKREAKGTKKIFQAIGAKQKVHFVPGSAGQHGSRALWTKFDDNNAYWAAVN